MARRRFFVDKLEAGRAVVRAPHAHHLVHVLRVRPGQVFEISDTRQLYLGRVVRAGASEVEFEIEGELALASPLPRVTLVVAIFKFERLEFLLEKATELGVAHVMPVITARVETGLVRAAGKRVERWRRIAFEAAQQSRRMAPMEIADPLPLGRALKEVSGACRWMLDESQGSPSDKHLLAPAPESALLVGPEGGWTDQERNLSHKAGFSPVGLGPLILRVETAALMALAVLMYVNTDPGA